MKRWEHPKLWNIMQWKSMRTKDTRLLWIWFKNIILTAEPSSLQKPSQKLINSSNILTMMILSSFMEISHNTSEKWTWVILEADTKISSLQLMWLPEGLISPMLSWLSSCLLPRTQSPTSIDLEELAEQARMESILPFSISKIFKIWFRLRKKQIFP